MNSNSGTMVEFENIENQRFSNFTTSKETHLRSHQGRKL
jgi:hypothetical protein